MEGLWGKTVPNVTESHQGGQCDQGRVRKGEGDRAQAEKGLGRGHVGIVGHYLKLGFHSKRREKLREVIRKRRHPLTHVIKGTLWQLFYA